MVICDLNQQMFFYGVMFSRKKFLPYMWTVDTKTTKPVKNIKNLLKLCQSVTLINVQHTAHEIPCNHIWNNIGWRKKCL